MKKVLCIAILTILCLPAVFAQQNTVTIRVILQDETGKLLPAVTGTITEKNTGKTIASSASDASGMLSYGGLKPGAAYQIVLTSAGFKSQTMDVIPTEKTTEKRITLQRQITEMDAVVVTALGIRKAEKAIGYAAQSIGIDEVNDARSNNFVHALSGKVAGLKLISPGSGPLNSTRISLRGDASLNPNGNHALIVLDGVPMNSEITSSGVNNAYGAGSGNDVPIDFGNSISDINPDDIENISVLKGPAATALYGSRASGGALLITTKSGKRGKGLGITVNSNFSINDVLKWPDYQYEYGQGTGAQYNAAGDKYYSYGNSEDGNGTHGTSSAFGPRFDGQMYYQYDPELEGQAAERSLWRPYKDNISSFWRTGFTLTNNISLEGGNEQANARASLTHTKNEWMMPNTGYERLSAAVSMNYKISEKLKIASKINFTNKQSDNLPATGYNNQSISYFMIFQNPNVDLDWYRPIWKNGKYKVDQIHPYSSFIDNPYLIAYEMTNGVKSNQVVGNLSAVYTINSNFDLMVRSSINMSAEERNQKRPYSTANFKDGFYKEQNINFTEVNTDALLTYRGRFGNDFSITSSIGANAMTFRYNAISSQVIGLVIPDVYMLSNGIGLPSVHVSDKNKNVHSVYGLASLGWQEKVFFDITGRNDWSSSLPTQNNSFFYPSVSNSIIWSDLIQLPQAISFAKTRLSYAQVGNDTDPYQTLKYYGTSPFPSSGSVPTTLHNIDFKPEISTSVEAGIDLRLFKNRLSFAS